ncbi:MAG: hypothetical protein AAFN10_08170 [Bacteroidota bacterium]
MKYSFLSLLFSLVFCLQAIAQSPIVPQGDANWPYRQGVRKHSFSNTRAAEPDTLSISANAPFFDDFTYTGPLPDSNRWFISNTNFDAPLVNQSLAVNPPTYGVISFDGNNRFNEPYDTENLSRGLCDQLVSHYIDLASYGPLDNLWLSFALQPQGLGDAPEINDSFFVYFRVPDLGIEQQVYARGGSDLHGFEQISIPINQADYFQTRFQMIFESSGSQNGQLDLWHLDYVYLAPGRSANDTIFDDYAAIEIERGPIGKFTAIPLQQLGANGNLSGGFNLKYRNLSSTNYPITTEVSISDPVGGNIFSGFSNQSVVVPLNGQSIQTGVYGAFGQPFLATPGVIELDIQLPNDDEITSNNELKRQYRIDSIFAYDDGVAEQSFGINKPWGVANAFYSPIEDSIQAVWISFVPTLNYNPITTQLTYMDEASFRLTIWKDPHPDSILLQQIGGSKINYGDQSNHFQRYVLSKPVAVQDSFWVGVVQISSEPIGLGWDKNNLEENLIWFDSSGVWKPIGLQGSLMIRPEFQLGISVPANIQSTLPRSPKVYLYPNPIGAGQVLSLRGTLEASRRNYVGRLLDIQGNLVTEYRFNRPMDRIEIQLPSDLPKGLYLWQHIFEEEQKLITEKILVQ